MLFVVLLGTVVKDTSVSKAAKSMYSMNDSDKDDTSSTDDTSDGKEAGKESADKFHFAYTEFTFTSDIYQTLFSSVSTHCLSIDDPYLDSISQPPEVKA